MRKPVRTCFFRYAILLTCVASILAASCGVEQGKTEDKEVRDAIETFYKAYSDENLSELEKMLTTQTAGILKPEDEEKRDKTKSIIKELYVRLNPYIYDNQYFNSGDAGNIKDLFDKLKNQSVIEEVPSTTDDWGYEIQYELYPSPETRSFIIISFGSDGKAGIDISIEGNYRTDIKYDNGTWVEPEREPLWSESRIPKIGPGFTYYIKHIDPPEEEFANAIVSIMWDYDSYCQVVSLTKVDGDWKIESVTHQSKEGEDNSFLIIIILTLVIISALSFLLLFIKIFKGRYSDRRLSEDGSKGIIPFFQFQRERMEKIVAAQERLEKNLSDNLPSLIGVLERLSSFIPERFSALEGAVSQIREELSGQIERNRVDAESSLEGRGAEFSRETADLRGLIIKLEHRLAELSGKTEEIQRHRTGSEREKIAGLRNRIELNLNDLLSATGKAGVLAVAVTRATTDKYPDDLRAGVKKVLNDIRAVEKTSNLKAAVDAVFEMEELISGLDDIERRLAKEGPGAMEKMNEKYLQLKPSLDRYLEITELLKVSYKNIENAVLSFRKRFLEEIGMAYRSVLKGYVSKDYAGALDGLLSDLGLEILPITLGETPYNSLAHKAVSHSSDSKYLPGTITDVRKMGYRNIETSEIEQAQVVVNSLPGAKGE